jgi:hypothetical protein
LPNALVRDAEILREILHRHARVALPELTDATGDALAAAAIQISNRWGRWRWCRRQSRPNLLDHLGVLLSIKLAPATPPPAALMHMSANWTWQMNGKLLHHAASAAVATSARRAIGTARGEAFTAMYS